MTFSHATKKTLVLCFWVAACGTRSADVRDDRSALAATSTFGNTTPGPSWVTSTADYKRASRFSLAEPNVTVNALAAYVDGLGLSSGSQAARGVIYADDGTRVCQTTDTSVSAGDAASWKTMTISGTCTLSAGSYWLALHTGGPTEGVLRYNVAALAGGLHHDADLFSDGAASTFGAASTANWQLAIYASYTPNVHPTVTWAKPLDGQKVSGQLNEANGNCEAVATENQGTIDRVDFYLDGTLLNTERYVPYSCIWDTSTAADGSAHTLRAVAYDTSGNSSDASIKVTVANGTPPPPINIRCDQTIAAGESFATFLGRVGSGQDGCLTAGTYEVGVATGWRSGQKIHPAPTSTGRYQNVTLRGNLSINVPGVVLDDIHVVGLESLASINGKVIEIGACDNCTFDHLEVTMDPPNAGLQGFLNYLDTTGLHITNNRIHHVGFDNQFEHGIYCSHEMHSGLIEGNWIYANAAFGIQFYPDCDDVTFRYNVVDDNGYSITLAGEGSTTSDRVVVSNCLLTNAHGGKFAASTVACYTPGSSLTVKDVWATPATTDCPSSIFANALLTGDPEYVDTQARDYRLRPGSPARAIMGAFSDAIPGPRN